MFGSEINRVDHTKFLGIYIDEKMSWKIHTNFVVGKLSRMVGILSRIQENLPRSALKTLYCSFFQPSIQYGTVFWFFVSTDVREKLLDFRKKP